MLVEADDIVGLFLLIWSLFLFVSLFGLEVVFHWFIDFHMGSLSFLVDWLYKALLVCFFLLLHLFFFLLLLFLDWMVISDWVMIRDCLRFCSLYWLVQVLVRKLSIHLLLFTNVSLLHFDDVLSWRLLMNMMKVVFIYLLRRLLLMWFREVLGIWTRSLVSRKWRWRSDFENWMRSFLLWWWWVDHYSRCWFPWRINRRRWVICSLNAEVLYLGLYSVLGNWRHAAPFYIFNPPHTLRFYWVEGVLRPGKGVCWGGVVQRMGKLNFILIEDGLRRVGDRPWNYRKGLLISWSVRMELSEMLRVLMRVVHQSNFW